MKEIPLLEAKDIDIRFMNVNKRANGIYANLLLYKNARTDMRILDEVFGVLGWQRTHEVINGNLFCSIDIWDDDKKCWVRKQDVGVESFADKEKGEASDSFKRAGTNVGIGRELYTAPKITVKLADNEWYEKNGKYIPTVSFKLRSIEYNENKEIIQLTLIDKNGNVRFDFKEYTETTDIFCEHCKSKIVTTKSKNGRDISPQEISRISLERFGEILCPDCQIKRKEENNAE